ncbi:MAG: efflux RND transporter periplasmic adaptor subunit [Planctomycetota bacterium]
MSGVLKALLGLLVLLALAAGAWFVASPQDQASAELDHPTAIAQRGSLTISVTESGTIRARDQVVIKSEVEGQTTILYLVPEGTRVREGDLLVELDTSSLQDRLVEQEIQVKNSDTSYIRARENLEVVKKQAESNIALATRDLRFAQEDLKQFIDGEFPKQLKEANSKITLALEELENATEKLEWSQTLRQEKYISDSELEADRLAKSRQELEHELAVANRDLLQNYTYRRQLDQLNSDIEEAQRALERVQLTSSSDIIQAQADLESRQAELERQRSKLTKLQDQIQKARIVSPANAMVVYATSARGGGFRGNEEPLDEGQSVRERQELIHLPTTDAIMVELKVHESNLDKIVVGLAVRVKVDAIPGKTYRGTVDSIAPLPDAQSMWMNPDLKVYRTQVNLEDFEDSLRTGMSCQCEILIDHYDSAVYVPLQAVVRAGAQTVVHVQTELGFEPRVVEIGRDNNRVVVIASGLEAGEVVSLAPPLVPDGSAVAGGESGESADSGALKREIEAARERQQKGASGSVEPAPTRGADAGDDTERPRRTRRTRDGGSEGASAGGGADRFQNMTSEEREAMRERFRNMTPEEREKLRGQRGGGGGRANGGTDGGAREPSDTPAGGAPGSGPPGQR